MATWMTRVLGKLVGEIRRKPFRDQLGAPVELGGLGRRGIGLLIHEFRDELVGAAEDGGCVALFGHREIGFKTEHVLPDGDGGAVNQDDILLQGLDQDRAWFGAAALLPGVVLQDGLDDDVELGVVLGGIGSGGLRRVGTEVIDTGETFVLPTILIFHLVPPVNRVDLTSYRNIRTGRDFA